MKPRGESWTGSAEKAANCGIPWRESEHLVREGVAYARSIDGATEESRFLSHPGWDSPRQSRVRLSGHGQERAARAVSRAVIQHPVPQASRRVLVNLTLNALKFAARCASLRSKPTMPACPWKSHGSRPRHCRRRVSRRYFDRCTAWKTLRNRSTGGTGPGPGNRPATGLGPWRLADPLDNGGRRLRGLNQLPLHF